MYNLSTDFRRFYRCRLMTEFGIFIAGIIVYLPRTPARDRVGRLALAVLTLSILLPAVPAAFRKLVFVPPLALILPLPLGNRVDRRRILLPSKRTNIETGADKVKVVS